jgi:hypothetical protein
VSGLVAPPPGACFSSLLGNTVPVLGGIGTSVLRWATSVLRWATASEDEQMKIKTAIA